MKPEPLARTQEREGRAALKEYANARDRAKGHAMNIDQMNREWYVWRAMCEELALLGVDINAHDPLANAIRRWGEELVQLRLLQVGEESSATEGADIPTHALATARAAFPDGIVVMRTENAERRGSLRRRS